MTMTDASTPVSLVPGTVNFRDVGGLPAATGVTRSGVLYRSGSLANLEEAGRETISTLGLRRIIDLRDEQEVTRQPSLIDGIEVERLRVPLFLGSSASFFDEDLSLTDMYRTIVADSHDRVVQVVRGVLEHQPVLVHCTAGKDRTGVTVAMALSAAGVERDAVIADYARTEDYIPAELAARVVAHLRSRHPGNSSNLEELAAMAPARVMRELLAGIDRDFGSPTEYLRAGGLDDADFAELRRVLVVAS